MQIRISCQLDPVKAVGSEKRQKVIVFLNSPETHLRVISSVLAFELVKTVKMNVKKFTLINLISFILIICFLSHQVLSKKGGGSNIVIGGGEYFCFT